MSGWDDPAIVTERLGSSLISHGLKSESSIITSSIVAPLTGHSGLSGEMSLLTLMFSTSCEGESKTAKLVLKRTRPTEDAKKFSKQLGLYREAIFYNTIGPWLDERLANVPSSKLHDFIPKALFAASDPSTGQKAIVLEMYNATEAGIFYPHSVHNINRSKVGQQESISSRSVTIEATRIAAFLHGAFYNDTSLLTNKKINANLRMADWIQGMGEETFLASQREVCSRWAHTKAQWEKGQGEYNMERRFVDLMDASCAQALDFEKFVKRWKMNTASSGTGDESSNGTVGFFSLTHGDFHPGNLLCLHSSSAKFKNEEEATVETPRLILLDWEVVGVGSGPQDIGQYLISHTPPNDAHEMLDEITSVYRDTLVETIDAADATHSSSEIPPLEDLRREIIYGGFERWVWLFGYMCGCGVPPLYMQYFHDQVYGWASANGISIATVGMPRP